MSTKARKTDPRRPAPIRSPGHRQDGFSRDRRTALLLGLVALSLGCTGDQELEPPAPLYGQLTIDYPIELWDRDIEGRTLLRVRVTDVGGVDSIQVLESSGHPAFDSAAIHGAKGLRFTPARRNGKRIDVWAQVPVQFAKRPRPLQ
jgi:TonB family protein